MPYSSTHRRCPTLNCHHITHPDASAKLLDGKSNRDPGRSGPSATTNTTDRGKDDSCRRNDGQRRLMGTGGEPRRNHQGTVKGKVRTTKRRRRPSPLFCACDCSSPLSRSDIFPLQPSSLLSTLTTDDDDDDPFTRQRPLPLHRRLSLHGYGRADRTG